MSITEEIKLLKMINYQLAKAVSGEIIVELPPKPAPTLTFGERLAELLRERQWSNYDLCLRSGVPVLSIKNYLDGISLPTMANLYLLSRGFGITMSKLLEQVRNP